MGAYQPITHQQGHSFLSSGVNAVRFAGGYVSQNFPHRGISDVAATVRAQFGVSGLREQIRPGMRIAIGVGSRGIKCLGTVVREVVAILREAGAQPFIVPAMGSHGGATPEGQRAVLAGYGISEESLGVPVEAAVDVEAMGEISGGTPIYFSSVAMNADGILPIARIKPHTSFRSPVESGVLKMLAVGLGKQKGAASLHSLGFIGFGERVAEAADLIIGKAPVMGGVAIVEDAYDDPALIEVIAPHDISRREPALLTKAKEWMGRILVDEFDVLIVDRIGKNISGTGMDPNITGRYSQPNMSGGPSLQRIVVLDLTPETHGNACGIGAADITTQTLFEQIDFYQMYTNSVTSTAFASCKLPLVMPTKEAAVALAIDSLNGVTPGEARIVRIANTLDLQEIWVSSPLFDKVESHEAMSLLQQAELDLSKDLHSLTR